ncbi:MAG: ribosomal protein S18-alanine N-acetyltransferase [Candidatus Marinimicrobia bacterium]|jgi:ribosomal-protein-alanine N-acetyltransferase|nr:ribosomal protein S18-alanine N-acetyltransferase [Candidatus Neomarinimicrobiota bacterium]|tara:strand:+ start:1834 stop:2271 length:438 start_codon:yes stop_codon:yes gene_type:complete
MIRCADLNDVDAITAIEKRVFRHPWSKNQIVQELEQENGKKVFAEFEEKMISYIMISYIMIRVVNNEAQILNIAVDLPYQHRGYGKKLLQYTLSELGTETDVFLEVRESNLPAIKLYSEFNFEEIGVREHYYSDGEDAIIMHKKQ